MRTIERTTQFKWDFKREMKGRHRPTLEADLTSVLRALVGDAPLAEKYRDHPLSGEWSAFATVTSSQTWCSFTRSRIRTRCGWCGSGRTANSGGRHAAGRSLPA